MKREGDRHPAHLRSSSAEVACHGGGSFVFFAKEDFSARLCALALHCLASYVEASWSVQGKRRRESDGGSVGCER